jgi:hypothetical protein
MVTSRFCGGGIKILGAVLAVGGPFARVLYSENWERDWKRSCYRKPQNFREAENPYNFQLSDQQQWLPTNQVNAVSQAPIMVCSSLRRFAQEN